MAVLVKVVPDGVSTCPLTGLASEPQPIRTNQKWELCRPSTLTRSLVGSFIVTVIL